MWNIKKKLSNFIHNPLLLKLDEIKQIQNNINDNIKAINEQEDNRFFALYKKNDESLVEAKIRFFKSLSTTDEYMLIKQKGDLIILKEFCTICNANKLKYSIVGGTLLGALRHGGFIPWDDDLDVVMEIEDFSKFKKIIKDNKNFYLTYKYDIINYFRLPKLIFKNHKSTWCLDIFLYRKCSIDSDEAYKMYLNVRQKLKNVLLDLKNNIPDYFFDYEIDSKNLSIINKSFDKINSLYEYHICNSNNITCYVRQADIFNDLNYAISLEDIYPLKTVLFSNISTKIINNYQPYLYAKYGDILKMPLDIYTHVHEKNHPTVKELNELYIFLDNYEK